MSDKSRNLIAIIVGTIAVVIIVALIVLASVRVTPFNYKNGSNESWIGDYDKVVVYYDGNQLSGADDAGYINGKGEQSGKYTYNELFDMLGFSAFTGCIQFNYNYGLTLSDESDVRKNEITVKDLKSTISSETSAEAEGYTFIISLSETKTLKLKDSKGAETGELQADGSYVNTQYDTVMFRISERDNWITSITAYAYMSSDLNMESDAVGAETKAYYKLKFGCRTMEIMETLDDIHGIDSNPESEETSTDEEESTEETESAA